MTALYNAPGRFVGVSIEEWAQATASALATAFGGYSQYQLRYLAEAALGQRNNGGGRRPGRTEALAALTAWAADRFEMDEVRAELEAGWPVDAYGLPDVAGPLPEAV